MRWLNKMNYDFIGKRYTFMSISLAMIVISVISIVFHGGLNLGIDFMGGVLVQVKFDKPVDIGELRTQFTSGGLQNYNLQNFPNDNMIILRIKGKLENSAELLKIIRDSLTKLTGSPVTNIERVEYVGPVIGKYLAKQAVYALLLSFLGIIVYVAFRFKSSVWGVSGVIALVHDVFITVGLFSVLNREINVMIIAALLTLAGYSINDTIVIFDRIRENLTLLRKNPLAKILSDSINQTLSRTIITSLTVESVLLALFLFGGEVIHDFSLALLFGCFIGTYSTVFIASPIVYEWLTYRAKIRK
jgi:preprotein translocase subunit SecF